MKKYKNYNEYFGDYWNSRSINSTVNFSEITGSGDLPSNTTNEPNIDGLNWLRVNHPIIFDEFVSAQEHEFELFLEKSRTYGIKNICENIDDLESKSESLIALYVRMKDKLNRFRKLLDGQPENDESITDTLSDLSNYSNIAIIVSKNKWK